MVFSGWYCISKGWKLADNTQRGTQLVSRCNTKMEIHGVILTTSPFLGAFLMGGEGQTFSAGPLTPAVKVQKPPYTNESAWLCSNKP